MSFVWHDEISLSVRPVAAVTDEPLPWYRRLVNGHLIDGPSYWLSTFLWRAFAEAGLRSSTVFRTIFERFRLQHWKF